MSKLRVSSILLAAALVLATGVAAVGAISNTAKNWDQQTRQNNDKLLSQGKKIFRYDTFGDQAFWGDTLQLHKAIEGASLGGVGSGVSPRTALSVGLKVDVDALPSSLVESLKAGKVDLDSPATTLALLKLNAVVGVTGFFTGNGTQLKSIGIQCALCHSTVDNSFAFGIGHRLDGWANHDLNVGAIVSLSPNLQPVADLLSLAGTPIDVPAVKTVLASWGPGKFDAELFLDGKAFNPHQVTNGVDKGRVSGATLIPNAFDMAGVNAHTWTGDWGTTTYWNAFVANLEMHGKGTFFDPRLDDAAKYPIAASANFGHIKPASPGDDLITAKLPALHLYQISLPSPKPQAGENFNQEAAARGDDLFNGKAKCGNCHVEPLWTEPGWNLHTPDEVGVDAFQANRAPDNRYKTMNLAGIFVREQGLFMAPENAGRFYHDGRFKTLADVVVHYNTFMNLGLSSQEISDIVEYLKSL